MLYETLFFPQLVKRLHSVYGTHKFITVFTTARHMSTSYSQENVCSLTPFCFLTIYFNIIFPSAPIRFQAFSFPFSKKKLVSISVMSHAYHTPYPSHTFLFRRHKNTWRVFKITRPVILVVQIQICVA